MYTAASDTWRHLPALPFADGANASCTGAADGYIYFTDGDTGSFARLKIR